MFRTLYALCVVMLLASTAWTAAIAQSGGARAHASLGLIILVALQR